MKPRCIKTDAAPQPVGAYSQALAKGGLVFTSGQLPIDAKTGVMITDSIEEEVRQALHNLRSVVEAGGCNFSDTVKVTVFLTDLSLFKDVDRVYGEFFGDHRPARSVVEVKALPKGARVEIEAVAIS